MFAMALIKDLLLNGKLPLQDVTGGVTDEMDIVG